jgi:prepilin peptidase CpaA
MKTVLLFIVLALCTITDIIEKKIYNGVLIIALIAALTLNLQEAGFGGLFFSLKGLFAGTGMFFIPYLIGWIGAGDAKLSGIIGAFSGWEFAVCSALLATVAGGLMSLFILIKDRKLGMLIRDIYAFLTTLRPDALKQNIQGYTFPYAVAILIGACATAGLRVIGYA